MLTDEQYVYIVEGAEDMELDAIWDYFAHPFGTRRLSHKLESFTSRRDGFLWVVERLLKEKRIVLVDIRTHTPLVGSIESQIKGFRAAFPADDAGMDNGLWFFSPECPGGSAWQHE
ncbi:DUF596 domain-containing protein [Ralstonia sp. ASV6]|uniref:DUF596 domain-containing protein n=1 Tax=Ralstonia sp. ASV6 TaxID=2795124 RepID=UPI0018ED63D1|nr:DUF596 domain-containing protein [Ralstonia sp. ASV6]